MTAADTSALWADELDPGERRRVVVVAEVAGPAARLGLSRRRRRGPRGRLRRPDLADPDLLGDLCWYATQEITDVLR